MTDPNIAERATAIITMPGNRHILAVCVPPGTPIFDLLGEKMLGIVADRLPVVNGDTVYLSTNDYNVAKNTLPESTRN